MLSKALEDGSCILLDGDRRSSAVSEDERAYERAVYGGARSRPNILVFCTCGRDAICPSKRCSSHCVELC